MQLRALKAHAGHRGWTVTVTVRDVGSGASERPQRELLIKMARRREIDAVLVWRLGWRVSGGVSGRSEL